MKRDSIITAGRRWLSLSFMVLLTFAMVIGARAQEQSVQLSTRQKLMNLLKDPQIGVSKASRSHHATQKKAATNSPVIGAKKGHRFTSTPSVIEKGNNPEKTISELSQTTSQSSAAKPEGVDVSGEAEMITPAKVVGGLVLIAAVIFITLKRRSIMKWFYDLTLKTKLLSSFLGVAFVSAIIGLVGITEMRDMNAADTMMYEKMTVPTAELGDIQSNIQATAAQVYSLLLSTNAEDDRKSVEKIDQLTAKVDADLVSFDKTIIAQSIRDAFKDFVAARSEYLPKIKEIVDLAMANKKREAYAFAKTEAAPIRMKMATALDKLVELKTSRAKETANENTQLASQATLVSSIIMAIGIGLAIALGFFIARIISNPVKNLAAQAETIAGGDLTVEVVQHSKDEVGQLAASFKEMVENLRQTIGQVGEASSAVASASSEISSSTEEMAAGAQEQTSQASEVASAVEEMTKTIVENSKNAGNTADTAKQAKQAAELGGQVVEATVEGMKRIANVVNKSAETVKALGKSSDQIGEIIGVIDDIADQTNLLALNAAIEAARAGEQGRGFAVVADEVRKLAERTTKATKEIAGMIKAIQADTTGAVTSMNEGTKQVDEGIKLADKAGLSLHEIVEVSQRVTDMVSQIAAASEEQSSASEQISKNVEGISSVTNQTAAGVQQIARAAEDLNRLTENLQQLLGRFKLTAGSAEHKTATVHHAPKLNVKHKEEKSKLAVRENGALVPHE